MHHDALLEWLYGLQGPALKWDLETARLFLARLGDPQRAYPSVHVAGTNGKGSVAAMVHAIALAAGLDAGLTTSPHLVRPEERIRLGAGDIAPAAFRGLVERLRDEAARALPGLPRHPSFFEMLTAAAFVAFAERRVDLAVVETGLGGRLDATNVLEPRVAVITTIGLDHVATLGGTLASIAREKAGIAKPGVPLVLGWIAAGPRAAIEEHAARAGAPVHRAARELRLRRAPGGGFDLRTPVRAYAGLACALPGPHQARNAALAVRAAELLAGDGFPLDEAAVRAGLASVRWPARLERIDASRVARPLPARASFLVDGAHNPEGARALARFLAVREADRERRVVLFAATEGREVADLVRPLATLVDAVVVTRAPIAKAQDPHAVAARLVRALPAHEVVVVEELDEALAAAAARAGDAGEVVVCGSLYLAGAARAALLGLGAAAHPARETHVAAAGVTP